MVTNALTNKGHANRRPAVCKDSPPVDCPYGFVELELLAITDDPLLEITFVGTLSIPDVAEIQDLEAEWSSNVGLVVAPTLITPGTAFFPVVSGLQSGDNVVLYLKAKDSRGCTYRGTATATADVG